MEWILSYYCNNLPRIRKFVRRVRGLTPRLQSVDAFTVRTARATGWCPNRWLTGVTGLQWVESSVKKIF